VVFFINMPGFEDALQREQRRQAALLHQQQMDARRSDQTASDEAEAERQRVEAVRRSPEWRQMVELSRDPSFLQALEAYWDKFVIDKEERTFENSFGVIGQPSFSGSYNWIEISHGVIQVHMSVEMIYGFHPYDGESRSPRQYNLYIYYNNLDIDQICTEEVKEPISTFQSTKKKKVKNEEVHYVTPKGIIVSHWSPWEINSQDCNRPHPGSLQTLEQWYEVIAQKIVSGKE
jgi:hypothetical protein